jgi:hypothetical protein
MRESIRIRVLVHRHDSNDSNDGLDGSMHCVKQRQQLRELEDSLANPDPT